MAPKVDVDAVVATAKEKGINPYSPATQRALRIIRDHSDLQSPAEFARLMWPDAPGWRVSVRCGPNGSTRGRQMVSAGGAYLSKLRRAGLINWLFRRGGFGRSFWLTRGGDATLKSP